MIRPNIRFLPLKAALLLFCNILLTACAEKTASVSQAGGVGRLPENMPAPTIETIDALDGRTETPSEGYVPPPLDELETETNSETKSADEVPADGKKWEVKNGVYVYNIPKRDTSGLATLSEMDSTPNVPMEDQPDDWYPGKWNYNEATGESTVVWDRWQSTLDIVKKYHAIYTGDETRKVCYLTFDCGYEYGTTSRILDTLKEKKAPAMFFLTGDYVESEYDLMKRMQDEGHLIGNHTMDHVSMNTVSVDEFQRQLNDLEKLFTEQFPNAQPLVYFRPPKGSSNEWVFKLADKMGYKTVMWSATYKDYDTSAQWSYDDALATCKNQLRPGVVYLLHAESETNTQILGDLIDWIRAQGYEILPMCDYDA